MSRDLAPWATPAGKPRPRLAGLISGLARDAASLRASSVPAGLPPDQVVPKRRARAGVDVRPAVGRLAVRVRRNLRVELVGLSDLRDQRLPVLLAANHPSDLDLPVLLSVLPRGWRVVPGSSARLLAGGASCLVFPEGEPEVDGHLAPFAADVFAGALAEGVDVIPVAVQGTFAASSRLTWRGTTLKPRVTVRLGLPIETHGRSAEEVAAAAHGAVAALLAEGSATWWQTLHRADEPALASTAQWRRAWDASQPEPEKRRRIWR